MNDRIAIDRMVTPAGAPCVRYVALSLEAPEAPRRGERRAVNLALVLDRSGSMGGGKLDNARAAARSVLKVLRPSDRVGVVAYDHEVQVLTPSCPATADARSRADRALSGLEARGNTNLSGGWLKGCEQVALGLDGEQIGRCLLLTDGLANEGITSPDELVRHARALRERGVTTSAFGVGKDFDEVLLRRLAEAGGGNFYFIEAAEQISEFIRGEVDEALEITARDVAVRVRAPEGVRAVSLNEFSSRRDEDGFRFELGSMVSRQVLEPVFELHVPAGVEGSTVAVEVSVVDRDGALSAGPFALTLRRLSDAAYEATEGDRDVLRRAADLRAARASRAALEQNRAGLTGEARQGLLTEAGECERLLPGDEVVRALVEQLRQKAEEFSVRMEPGIRKGRYFEEYGKLKGRGFGGKAMRKEDGGAPPQAPRAAPGAGALLLVPLSGWVAAAVEQAVRRLLPAAPVLGGIGLSHGLQSVDREPAGRLAKSEEQALAHRAGGLAGPVRLVVTEQGLDDNWFSHWHRDQNVAFASLYGWAATASVSPAAFVAYEALLFGLYARSASYDHKALLHGETRGCIFDLCRLRAEIEVKLQAADLCPACRVTLTQVGIDPATLAPFCEAIRSLARAT